MLASTEVSDAMAETGDMLTSGTNRIALNHEYGAGMVNALSLCSIASYGYYNTGLVSTTNTVDTFTVNFSRTLTSKSHRFCLCWDKVNTDNGQYSFTSEPLNSLYLKVTTPSGLVYISDYQHDNKQMVSFNASESGTYTIEIGIINATSSMINYSLSYYRNNDSI